MSEHTELGPGEREKLAALRNLAPPPALEASIAAELRRRGLLAPARRRGIVALRIGAAAAAAVVLFAAGMAAGRRADAGAPASPVSDLPEFALLLRELPAGVETGKREEDLVAEYRNWAMEVAAQGRLELGAKLAEAGRLLSGSRPAMVSESVSQPGAGLAGLFIVRAADYDAAVELARGCPHLGYGGTIEVRAIEGSGKERS